MKNKTISLLLCAALLLSGVLLPPERACAKTAKSFSAAIATYDEDNFIEYTMYYNYLQLTTPIGQTKNLAVAMFNGQMAETDLWYMKDAKATKYCKLSGNIIYYDPAGNWIITSFYAGGGYGSYTYYEYDGKTFSKKYNEGYDRLGNDGVVIEENEALEKLTMEAGVDITGLEYYSSTKNSRGDSYKLKYKRIMVKSVTKNSVKYYNCKYTAAKGFYKVGKLKTLKLSKKAYLSKLPKNASLSCDKPNIKCSLTKMKKIVAKYRKKKTYMCGCIEYKKIGSAMYIVKLEEALNDA
ncbi:MAG TPA: hypothetical protein DCP06_04165 [Lachnospiraceae bacterium]|nr:hypothetical protein [Lachnospiraceae bacterium]